MTRHKLYNVSTCNLKKYAKNIVFLAFMFFFSVNNFYAQEAQIYLDQAYEYLAKDPVKVSEYLEKASALITENSEVNIQIEYFVVKSILNRVNGNIEEGLKTATAGLELSKKSKDSTYYRAKLYNAIGSLYDDASDINLAIDNHLTALRFAEKLDDPAMKASILGALGRAYLYLAEHKIAQGYLLQAIAIKEEQDQIDKHLATYYTNLSNCYDAVGDFKNALLFLDKSIVIKKRNKNHLNLISSYNNKAYTLLLMKDYKDAEVNILEAIHLADSLNNGKEQMYAYSTYAEILFGQNKIKEAEHYMNKSTILSKKYRDFYLEQYNWDLLYNISKQKRNYKDALVYFERKKSVTDSIYNIEKRQEVERLALDYETEKKNREIRLLNAESIIKEEKLKKSTLLWTVFLISTLLALAVILLLWSRQRNKVKTDLLIKEGLQRNFEQQLAESEMSALRAQMNPHFLFNCLNSINSFIIKNEQEHASQYLSKFSKLIRRVLSNSKLDRVPISDELEALKLYIEMEALRFKNKFEYELIIDDSVEQDFLQIPPLLIQPYVENSIWHGLMHKTDGKGKLLIAIEQTGNELVCLIEDNGIGRDAAAFINSKSAVKKKSYGMDITQKRLKYINHKYNAPTHIEVLDLKDEENHAIGTRVIIKIGIEIEKDE